MDEQEKRDHRWRIGLIIVCWLVAVSLFVLNLLKG
jgi:hypothetical protein